MAKYVQVNHEEVSVLEVRVYLYLRHDATLNDVPLDWCQMSSACIGPDIRMLINDIRILINDICMLNNDISGP